MHNTAPNLDITNPLHYTCANNADGVMEIVVRKYNMPPPLDIYELIDAATYILETKGKEAEDDLRAAHPDYSKKYTTKLLWYSYITENKGLTTEEINAKIATLESELEGEKYVSQDVRDEVEEKIKALRVLLMQKNNGGESKLNIMNNKLLIGIAIFALLIFGSKLFNK